MFQFLSSSSTSSLIRRFGDGLNEVGVGGYGDSSSDDISDGIVITGGIGCMFDYCVSEDGYGLGSASLIVNTDWSIELIGSGFSASDFREKRRVQNALIDAVDLVPGSDKKTMHFASAEDISNGDRAAAKVEFGCSSLSHHRYLMKHLLKMQRNSTRL